MSSDNKNISFFEELKRRNVYRVGVAYVVLTWLILQVVETITPILSLPEFAPKLVLIVLAVAFPAVLLFAWAFELTPEGIKREKDVDRSQSITSHTGQRLDRITIGVVLVAIGILVVDRFILPDEPTAQPVAEQSAVQEEVVEVDEAPSIAVLPFMNMSNDENSAYFSDGLADTVLHMLAQIPEIRVAARTSSFQFRDQAMDVSKIGEQLNVGTVLEGSVQRAGDKIRITAQLIDVDNGFHLWSGNFDRDLDDVFAIQDEIANEVVAALKVSLLGEVAGTMDRDQTENIDAYTEYLLGLNALSDMSVENFSRSIAHLRAATEHDPNYARAWSTLGYAYLRTADYGVLTEAEGVAMARDAASRALDLVPDSSEALAVLGFAELLDGNDENAGRLLEKAIEVNPNDAVAAGYYGTYLRNQARPREALQVLERAARLDPLSETPIYRLAYLHLQLGDLGSVNRLATRLTAINPDGPNVLGLLADIARQHGEIAKAIELYEEAFESDPNDPDMPAEIAFLYLSIDMPDEAQRWFDRAVEIDPAHPQSQAAPLHMSYYTRENLEESTRLARRLLEEKIEYRGGARSIALQLLYEHSLDNDQIDSFLEVLDNLYPHLFEDAPLDYGRDWNATYWVGIAEFRNGNEERGAELIRAGVNEAKKFNEAYNRVNLWSISAEVLLGDRDPTLPHDELAAYRMYPNSRFYMYLKQAPNFDFMRDDPQFMQIMDAYEENALVQQQILNARNEN